MLKMRLCFFEVGCTIEQVFNIAAFCFCLFQFGRKLLLNYGLQKCLSIFVTFSY